MTADAVKFLARPRGYAALDERAMRRATAKSARRDSSWRFFLKVGETKRVIFLTDDPPIIPEHNLKLEGTWGHLYTCLGQFGEPCPLCEAGHPPDIVGFYAVIDRTEFTTREGKPGKDTIRVLAAKIQSLKQFKKYSQKYGGLVGVEFEVDRTGPKSANVGNVYTKEATHTTTEVEGILGGKALADVVPNWDEYFAPKSGEELQTIVETRLSVIGTQANAAARILNP